MAELEQDQASHREITTLTAEIVGAYVGHHKVAAIDLPALIATVGKGLASLGQTPAEPEEEKPTPAVSIKRSVTEDEIVCLICGKPQKMLKRHLATRHALEPDAYRAMFGLKDEYPMVAPSYAATRSALAKKIGLGRKPEPEKPAKPARAPRKRATTKPEAKTDQARPGRAGASAKKVRVRTL
ncbi:MAG: MucR family transcriptional regulator [Rhizobiales bacterium]|nr:MucR family transcriptional regulator [Hyphomicrobiales bacterium]